MAVFGCSRISTLCGPTCGAFLHSRVSKVAEPQMIVILILMFSRMTKQESTIVMMCSSVQSGNQAWLYWTVILLKEYTTICLLIILC